MFDGIGSLINGLFIISVISVPLAIWKAVEIIIWLYHHISISCN